MLALIYFFPVQVDRSPVRPNCERGVDLTFALSQMGSIATRPLPGTIVPCSSVRYEGALPTGSLQGKQPRSPWVDSELTAFIPQGRDNADALDQLGSQSSARRRLGSNEDGFR